MTLDEARSAAIACVRDEYPHAREAVVALEVFTRSRSKKAVYELRDFLDHVSTILRTDDEGIAVQQLHEARTHLRRCIVEPYEYFAEKEFVRLDQRVRWVRWLPIPNNPVRKLSFGERLFQAQDLIRQGRLEKGNNVAAKELMKRSYELTCELMKEIHPFRSAAIGFAWILGVAASTVTVLAWFHVDPATLLRMRDNAAIAAPVAAPAAAETP